MKSSKVKLEAKGAKTTSPSKKIPSPFTQKGVVSPVRKITKNQDPKQAKPFKTAKMQGFGKKK